MLIEWKTTWVFENTLFLNQDQIEDKRSPVRRSAVMVAFDRMYPKIDRVEKVVQDGSSEAGSTARKNQMKQVLIMQGKINKKQLTNKYSNGIPPEHSPDLLPNLSRHQVVFFDEMHVD